MKISVTLHKAPKKGEDQNLRQVIFRVREGNNDLKVRTDLMADPTIWDDSIPGYRRTTKLGKGGTNIIETINDMLKNTAQIVHSRHRSVSNFIMNLISALGAYCFFDNKPKALQGYCIEDTKQLSLF